MTVAIKNQSLFYPRETNKTLWSVTHVAGTGRKALVDKHGGLPWKPLAPALSESELGLTLLQVSAVFWGVESSTAAFCRNNLFFRQTAGSSWGHIVEMEPNLGF